MRYVVLDTETTGLEPTQGHRIIEIGAVELEGRKFTGRQLHQYLNPDREIEAEAFAIHGISNEFVADKPRFSNVVTELLEFLHGAEVLIHNASFDVNFINHELRLMGNELEDIREICTVTDTLQMARQRYPGQRASLNALCKRFAVDNSNRELHGALLDSELLAEVYLAMTGGQTSLSLAAEASEVAQALPPLSRENISLIQVSEADLASHQKWLSDLKQQHSW